MNDAAETPLEPTENDDLARLIEFAQIVTAGRDAMSDHIVARVAKVLTEGLNLLDSVTRNSGLMRLFQVLESEDSQALLIAIADALHQAGRDIGGAEPAAGGLGSILRTARDPNTQETLRALTTFGALVSQSLRTQYASD